MAASVAEGRPWHIGSTAHCSAYFWTWSQYLMWGRLHTAVGRIAQVASKKPDMRESCTPQ